MCMLLDLNLVQLWLSGKHRLGVKLVQSKGKETNND